MTPLIWIFFLYLFIIRLLCLKLESIVNRVMASSHCVENPPVPNPRSGQGRVQQLGGLHTYVTGSEDSKLAIILISDAFGKSYMSNWECFVLSVLSSIEPLVFYSGYESPKLRYKHLRPTSKFFLLIFLLSWM